MTDADIEKFLFREARLMDEHRYQEWLTLWASDAVYWVPCLHEDTDPLRQVSIIYDNRAKLEDRVTDCRAAASWPRTRSHECGG